MTAENTTILRYDELPGAVGRELGPSSWRQITQEQVDQFAEATDDDQWIHTDTERAADGPFGGTIAHGFLTLSLLIPMWGELLDVEGVTTKVNYGLDRVRFTSPVRVDSRVRMRANIASVTEVKGGYQLKVDTTTEIEGSERPAVVAEFLCRFYA